MSKADAFQAWCREQTQSALAPQFLYDEEHRVTGIVKRVSLSLVPVYEALRQIESPVLPRILEIRAQEGALLITEEYIEGKSLRYVLDEEGAQEDAFVIRAAKDILEALSILHNRIPPIIHRDIKPENIILRDNGRFVLIDFDAARDYSETAQTDTINLGTHGYAAPEQYGFAQTDARTDIYSLGVLLYELRMGEPYRLGTVCDGSFAKIIRKCTQFEAKNRYQSAKEIQSAIASAHWRRPRYAFVIAGILCIAVLGSILLRSTKFEPTPAHTPALEAIQPKQTDIPLQETPLPIETVSIGDHSFNADEIPSTPIPQLDREKAKTDGFIINEQNVLTQYTGPGGYVVIPDGVAAIYDNAFYMNKKITGVTIPEGVTKIGRRAFHACTNLTEIVFPQSVTDVEDMAFWRVPWISNQEEAFVIVGDGVLLHYGGQDENVVIPDNVKVVGSSAFIGNRRIKTVAFPKGLRQIGERAFLGCYGISEITIPGNVVSIKQEAFGECEGLKKVVIEDGTLEIEYRAFVSCEMLEAAVIPDSVVRIAAQAFVYAPRKFTIYASNGSIAQLYAEDNELRHKTGSPESMQGADAVTPTPIILQGAW